MVYTEAIPVIHVTMLTKPLLEPPKKDPRNRAGQS